MSYTVWCFRYTHLVIVQSDLIPKFTEVSGAVVILVCTIRDNFVADVSLLNFTDFANLVAFSTGFRVLYCAI